MRKARSSAKRKFLFRYRRYPCQILVVRCDTLMSGIAESLACYQESMAGAQESMVRSQESMSSALESLSVSLNTKIESIETKFNHLCLQQDSNVKHQTYEVVKRPEVFCDDLSPGTDPWKASSVEQMRSQLQCPICINLPKEKVYQCTCGNSLCEECKSKVILVNLTYFKNMQR